MRRLPYRTSSAYELNSWVELYSDLLQSGWRVSRCRAWARDSVELEIFKVKDIWAGPASKTFILEPKL